MVMPLMDNSDRPYVPGNGQLKFLLFLRWALLLSIVLSAVRLIALPLLGASGLWVVDLIHGLVIAIGGIFFLKDDKLFARMHGCLRKSRTFLAKQVLWSENGGIFPGRRSNFWVVG